MKKLFLSILLLLSIFALSQISSVSALNKNNSASIHIVKKDNFDLTTRINPESDSLEDYRVESRKFQSMAKIQCVGTRVFAAWVTGGTYEPHIDNYLVISYSDDGGKTWVDPYMIIDHDLYNEVYIGNSALFLDNNGKFWICYNKKGVGFCAITSTNADAPNIDDIVWSKERFCYEYGIENRPVILSSGEWLYTSRNTNENQKVPVISSVNYGNNFYTKSNAMSSAPASVKFAGESTIIEKENGVLALYSRLEAYGGIEVFYSYDQGASWTKSTFNLPDPLHGPGSRFVMIKLPSKHWLFVTNDSLDNRSYLTAYLSTDEGQTWSKGLLLDSRLGAEYPDATYDEQGNIYVIYDQGRFDELEIRVCKFTEDDLLAGTYVSKNYIDKSIITKINPDYTDIVSSTLQYKSIDVTVGYDINSFVEKLPTSIEITDSNNNKYTINGTWNKSLVDTSKKGTYYLTFNGDVPSGLDDTYSSLLIVVHVNEKSNNKGCNSTLGILPITLILLTISVLYIKKETKYEESI